jgi:YVTN family beta-propeller protein
MGSRKVIAEIKAGNFSNGVAMAPDGSRVYVSNGKDGTVSVIRTSDNQVEATIPVGKRPGTWPSPPTAASSTWPTAAPTACR